jgi:hypothetical protein
MCIPQSAVSKIEGRTDAYINTIRRYREAMGGEDIGEPVEEPIEA